MNCRFTRKHIPAYVDGALGAAYRWILRQHLVACSDCLDQYEREETLIDSAADLQPVQAPASLRTLILLAVWRESESRWERLYVRFQNWTRPIAVPATGGILSAVILFVGLMSHISFAPQDLSTDIPLTYLTKTLVTHPIMSMAPPFGVPEDIGVEAFIDGQGNVYDFRITHLPSNYPVADAKTSAKLRAELANALLATRFDPATSFGLPRRGRVLLSFRPVTHVQVRG